MGSFNFTTIAPYIMLISGVLILLVNAFVLSRKSSKEWIGWYHKISMLRPIGGILSAFFFICDVIFLWTYKYNKTLAFIMILISCICVLLGLILYIRMMGLQREAKEKNKTF